MYHKEREVVYYNIEALPYGAMASEKAGPWNLFCVVLLFLFKTQLHM